METNTYNVYSEKIQGEFGMLVIPAGKMNDKRMKELTEDGWELIEITDDGYGEGSFVFNRKR